MTDAEQFLASQASPLERERGVTAHPRQCSKILLRNIDALKCVWGTDKCHCGWFIKEKIIDGRVRPDLEPGEPQRAHGLQLSGAALQSSRWTGKEIPQGEQGEGLGLFSLVTK